MNQHNVSQILALLLCLPSVLTFSQPFLWAPWLLLSAVPALRILKLWILYCISRNCYTLLPVRGQGKGAPLFPQLLLGQQSYSLLFLGFSSLDFVNVLRHLRKSSTLIRLSMCIYHEWNINPSFISSGFYLKRKDC